MVILNSLLLINIGAIFSIIVYRKKFTYSNDYVQDRVNLLSNFNKSYKEYSLLSFRLLAVWKKKFSDIN